METTLDHQIGVLRKHAIEHEFTGRIAAAGGLLDASFAVVADVLEKWHYIGEGRLSMPQLKEDFLSQLLQVIDSLPIDERIKSLLRQELPFGTSVVLHLVEVVPEIVEHSGLRIEPQEVIALPWIIRSANQVGTCPGYIAPVIRREFTRYRDAEGVDWVRESGQGNERHDFYVAQNFRLNRDGSVQLSEATYRRIEHELQARDKKVSYGGCPASRYAIGHECGNLLNAMVHAVIHTCINHFDFQSRTPHLVRRSNTVQVFFPDPSPDNRDLYESI
jgi:hypothetical protein